MQKLLLRGNGAAIVIAIIAILIVVAGVTAVVTRPVMEEPSPSGMMNAEQTTDIMADTEDDDNTMRDSQEAVMDGNDPVTDSEPSTTRPGSYEAYAANKLALANSGDVVLFFRASWCPTCRALDANIKANLSAIPSDLTILDVNYDTETALKQQYGVTYQHTLVQVDAQGNLIKKWTNSPTLSSLASQVQ